MDRPPIFAEWLDGSDVKAFDILSQSRTSRNCSVEDAQIARSSKANILVEDRHHLSVQRAADQREPIDRLGALRREARVPTVMDSKKAAGEDEDALADLEGQAAEALWWGRRVGVGVEVGVAVAVHVDIFFFVALIDLSRLASAGVGGHAAYMRGRGAA